MLKHIRWVKIAVFLLIAGILLTLQHCLYPWPKRLPHVRLEPSRPILRDADVTPDNAFFYLRQLTKDPSGSDGWWKLTNNPKGISDDWWKDYGRFGSLGMQGGPYPALEARLTEVAGNLELCRQAAALPKCQVVTADSANANCPYLGRVSGGVRYLRFRAERATAQGDWTAAGDDYRIALRIGDHVSRGGGQIHRMIAHACCSISCDSLRRLTIDNEPPPEFLRGMIQFLGELDRNAEPFAEALRYDRLVEHDAVRVVDNRPLRAWNLGSRDGFPTETTPLGTFLAHCVLPLAGSTPRRTAAHLDAVYSYVIDIAAEPRPSGRSFDEALAFLADGRKPVRVLFDDPIGRMLALWFVPVLDPEAERHRAYVATLRGTELVLALRLYRRTHDGKLPARLEELVPDCLAAVPVDPFSRDGEPFLYRVDADGKWIVYSRGPNLRDDGAAWNYLDQKVRSQHRDSLDVIFSSSEFEQRRDNWRRAHPSANVER